MHYLRFFSTFNTMKHTLFFILGVLCLFMAKAQDTIYKRSGERIDAKITEISSTEVKYKRFTMQDGPLFIISRNDVQKIRFSNGVVDSFAVTQPVTTQTVTPSQSGSAGTRQAPMPTNVIQNPRAGLYYYNQEKVNEKRMLFIAQDKNRTWKNKELEKAITATRDFKSNQYISGFGGPLVALACIMGAGQIAQSNPGSYAPGALAFNGIGIFIASQIISPMFKRKRTQNARKVVELYNRQVQQN